MSSRPVDQQLNDLSRMRFWQRSFPELNLETPLELNEGVRDYLRFYGLEHNLDLTPLNYYAGFREFKSFSLFHQAFVNEASDDWVFIAHGYTDHAGIFSKVINYLLKSGRSVLVFDQPGHGLSSGERASIENFEVYRSLLMGSFRYFQAHFKKPFHLLAQSMGGALAMDCLQRENLQAEQLGKVILLAPLVRPKAWKQAVWSIRFLSLVTDSVARTISRNSEDEAFTRFVFYDDPVQHDRLPAQWVRAMIAWVKEFEGLGKNNFPIWLIQGDRDETVDWEYNVPFIENMFPNSKLRKVYGAGHHLAGESERLQKFIFAHIEEAVAS